MEQNEKASCIYDKLTEGSESILNDFISRYFPPVKPWIPALGELNLTWTLGSTTETLPYGTPNEDGTYNSVVIRLTKSSFDERSTTFNALNMLHEALHAKLIAEVYDEVGSTDFDKLYAHYQGFGFQDIDKQQEQEMLNMYLTDLATGLKNFDESQGTFNDLDEYKAAIRYDISVEVFGLSHSYDDYDSYLKILLKSTTNCNQDEK